MATCFICRKGNYFFYLSAYTCLNKIHSTYNISLYTFLWVIFSSRNNFCSSSMNYIINISHCKLESIFITNISNKESYTGIVCKFFCHFPLLHFVA